MHNLKFVENSCVLKFHKSQAAEYIRQKQASKSMLFDLDCRGENKPGQNDGLFPNRVSEGVC